MKKLIYLFLSIFLAFSLSSFALNKNVTIKGYIYASNNEPFVYPVFKSDDGEFYKIFFEKDEDKIKFLSLQNKHLKVKGYIEETETEEKIIYPNNYKIIKE